MPHAIMGRNKLKMNSHIPDIFRYKTGYFPPVNKTIMKLHGAFNISTPEHSRARKGVLA